MATMTDLTLKDAADVNIVYAKQKVVSGKEAFWTNRTNESLRMQPVASLFLNESVTTRKVNGKLTIPCVSTADSTKVVNCLFKYEFSIPLDTSLNDRKYVGNAGQAMLADAITDAAVRDGEMPWA